jgi:hypothetical protein
VSSLRGDIAVVVSTTALMLSMSRYFTACAALFASIAFLTIEER